MSDDLARIADHLAGVEDALLHIAAALEAANKPRRAVPAPPDHPPARGAEDPLQARLALLEAEHDAWEAWMCSDELVGGPLSEAAWEAHGAVRGER